MTFMRRMYSGHGEYTETKITLTEEELKQAWMELRTKDIKADIMLLCDTESFKSNIPYIGIITSEVIKELDNDEMYNETYRQAIIKAAAKCGIKEKED